MEDRVLFFCHIQKTGGQTICNLIQQAFGWENCLKVWDPAFGADVSPLDFADLEPQELRRYKAIVGHLPIGVFLRNRTARKLFYGGKVLMAASVREPVARIVSNYNYQLLNPHLKGTSYEVTQSLDEFALDVPENFQSRYLMDDPWVSIDNMLKRFTVFPIENSIHGVSSVLEKEFGCPPVETEIRNRTSDLVGDQRLKTKQDLSRATHAKLVERHCADRELYERAGGKVDLDPVKSTLWSRFQKRFAG